MPFATDSPIIINFTGSLMIYIDPIVRLHFHLVYVLVKSTHNINQDITNKNIFQIKVLKNNANGKEKCMYNSSLCEFMILCI